MATRLVVDHRVCADSDHKIGYNPLTCDEIYTFNGLCEKVVFDFIVGYRQILFLNYDKM